MDYTKKDYKVRIIPKVKKVKSEDEGTTTKVVYCRKSNPSEASIKAGFKKSDFYHLEIFDAGTGRLGGDVKPYTITVFSNSEKLLFDAINMIEGEDDHIILENSKVKVLKDSLPGLRRTRPCQPYYAMQMGQDGAETKLMQSERQPNGSFKNVPVVMESVSYFLFENELNEDSDNVKYTNAVKRAMRSAVTATPGGGVIVDEAKTAEVNAQDEGEEP